MQEPVWAPGERELSHSAMAALMREVGAEDYNALWQWSVEDPGRFWRTVWDKYEIQSDGDPTVALADATMPGASWFPNVSISFPEHVFRGKQRDRIAVHAFSEGGITERWSWARLG